MASQSRPGHPGESIHDAVAGDPERSDDLERSFLSALLAVVAASGPADAGIVFVCDGEDSPSPIAVYPPTANRKIPSSWLHHAAALYPQSIESSRSVCAALPDPNALYGASASRYIISTPLKLPGLTSHTVAFLTQSLEEDAAKDVRRRIELGVSVLQAAGMLGNSGGGETDAEPLQMSMETLAAFNLHRQFGSAAMALCNEVSANWHCDRVSVGFLKGPSIQVRTISHTADFSRKMQVVKSLEATMEECLDQDCEIVYPTSPEASFVSRAADELSALQGPLAIMSLPIRRGEEVLAVLTLERQPEKPFESKEVESVRLALELCSARLLDLHDRDRWVGAKIAVGVKRALASVLSPTHTWAKATAIAVSIAIIFLIFAKGEYRAEGMSLLEATERRTISAPFDGYLKTVSVEVGDAVVAGQTVLAELETEELLLQLAVASSEHAGYRKQADVARRDSDTALAQIAEANAEKVQAQISLLEYMISRAQVTSPLSGITVEGDLKRQIGAPLKTGDVLFEVSPLDSLRGTLNVPEDQIGEVRVGLKGELATASYPAIKIPFVVERIEPVARVINQRNVFEVRVDLAEIYPWMRPGMEGVGKITIDERSYAWIWTRKIVNWVRMKLWL